MHVSLPREARGVRPVGGASVSSRDLPPGTFREGPAGLPVAGPGLGQALSSLLPPKERLTAASLAVPDGFVKAATVDLEPGAQKRPRELAEMLRWKVSRLYGEPAPELRITWCEAGAAPDGGTRLLVLASPEETIASLEAAFLAHGIRIGALEPAALALSAIASLALAGTGLVVFTDGPNVSTVFLEKGRRPVPQDPGDGRGPRPGASGDPARGRLRRGGVGGRLRPRRDRRRRRRPGVGSGLDPVPGVPAGERGQGAGVAPARPFATLGFPQWGEDTAPLVGRRSPAGSGLTPWPPSDRTSPAGRSSTPGPRTSPPSSSSLAAIVLTVVSVRTVHAYLEGSRQSREEIASLRAEIGRFEASGREAEEKLARFDLAGMRAGAEEANELARLRAFSWSRFLTRLEKTLPNDVRVVSVSLSKAEPTSPARRKPAPRTPSEVALSLVSRDPDGLPKLIRAFYASPWFDAPTPVSETGGEQGSVEGRSFVHRPSSTATGRRSREQRHDGLPRPEGPLRHPPRRPRRQRRRPPLVPDVLRRSPPGARLREGGPREASGTRPAAGPRRPWPRSGGSSRRRRP